MSSINLPYSAGRVDTFTRQEESDTVHMQAVVPVDPATGDPLLLAQQATLAAVEELTETMVTLLSAMLKKMPRLTSGERLAATLVAASSDAEPTGYYTMNSSWTSDASRSVQYARMFEPWNFSDMGAARLYSQILVS